MTDHRPLAEQCDAAIRDIDRVREAVRNRDPRKRWLVYQGLANARQAKLQMEQAADQLQELLPNATPDLIADAINGTASFDRLLNEI